MLLLPLFKNRSTTALLHPTAPRLLGLQVASVAKGRTAAFPCCCPLCTRCLCLAASALLMAQGWGLNKEEEKKKSWKPSWIPHLLFTSTLVQRGRHWECCVWVATGPPELGFKPPSGATRAGDGVLTSLSPFVLVGTGLPPLPACVWTSAVVASSLFTQLGAEGTWGWVWCVWTVALFGCWCGGPVWVFESTNF